MSNPPSSSSSSAYTCSSLPYTKLQFFARIRRFLRSKAGKPKPIAAIPSTNTECSSSSSSSCCNASEILKTESPETEDDSPAAAEGLRRSVKKLHFGTDFNSNQPIQPPCPSPAPLAKLLHTSSFLSYEFRQQHRQSFWCCITSLFSVKKSDNPTRISFKQIIIYLNPYMVLSSSSSPPGHRRNPIRGLLGLGYWVQGFRCFPWLAVNFFLKDGLNLDPSTLQLLQNSANLPMVGKPLYGLISDIFYISGQHRIPYVALGAFLQAISWLSITLLSPSSVSMLRLSVYLLLSNLGASLAEVANDAIVAEAAGSQSDGSSIKSSQSSSASDLQSFVSVASSAGGVLGNLLGGIGLSKFSPRAMFLAFGIIAFAQFLITIFVSERSLNLPKASPNAGVSKQLLQLSVALRKREIAYSVTWLAASFAIIPALTGTMFYYQTQQLKIDSSVLGMSKVFGQAAMLIWSIVYSHRLKFVPPRKLIAAIQTTMAVLMISDALFVKGFYRNLGVPDSLYVVIFSGFLEVLYFFKLLPFNIVMTQQCPPGCEGSLMAIVASAIALSFIISGYLGIGLASLIGVTEDDFSGLPSGLVIQAICTAVPIYWSSCIPDAKKVTGKKE